MATGSMAAVRHDAAAVAKILHVIRDRQREIGRQTEWAFDTSK